MQQGHSATLSRVGVCFRAAGQLGDDDVRALALSEGGLTVVLDPLEEVLP